MLCLYVEKFNDVAIKLYESFGFVVDAETEQEKEHKEEHQESNFLIYKRFSVSYAPQTQQTK